MTPPERNIIVVDVEATGLREDFDIPVEVAWWNLTTDERGYFIPKHDVSWVLRNAQPRALEINGYVDRLQNAEQDAGDGVGELEVQLGGESLAGSNPAYDARMLGKIMPTAWHHRMWDLSNVAAVELCLDWLPGLADVCKMLAVDASPDHTAAGDVTVTGLAFRELIRRRDQRRAMLPD